MKAVITSCEEQCLTNGLPKPKKNNYALLRFPEIQSNLEKAFRINLCRIHLRRALIKLEYQREARVINGKRSIYYKVSNIQ